jgi:hypothetical protein
MIEKPQTVSQLHVGGRRHAVARGPLEVGQPPSLFVLCCTWRADIDTKTLSRVEIQTLRNASRENFVEGQMVTPHRSFRQRNSDMSWKPGVQRTECSCHGICAREFERVRYPNPNSRQETPPWPIMQYRDGLKFTLLIVANETWLHLHTICSSLQLNDRDGTVRMLAGPLPNPSCVLVPLF